MLVLRCTRKLLHRLKAATPEPTPSSTWLGDWYGNPVSVGHERLILCVSEKTLLPVIIPARDLRSFGARLATAAAEVLRSLCVTDTLVRAEIDRMAPIAFAPTNSRVVLGSMTDFACLLRAHLDPGRALLNVSLALAKALCTRSTATAPIAQPSACSARSRRSASSARSAPMRFSHRLLVDATDVHGSEPCSPMLVQGAEESRIDMAGTPSILSPRELPGLDRLSPALLTTSGDTEHSVTGGYRMNEQQMKAELERLKAENETLKTRASRAISMKVSEKGGVSLYGLGRFPVTLYKEQWAKLLDMADEIRAFLKDNDSKLKTKP